MIEHELPEGWSLRRLDEIILDFKRGPFGSAIKKDFFVSHGYKVYEQRNAIYKSYDIGNYYIDKSKFAELTSFEVVAEDFIVSCSGTIGKIYQIPSGAPSGIINQALLRLRVDNQQINNNFFYFLFEAEFFQSYITQTSKGVAIKNMASVKEMKKVQVPIPPLPIQKQIVAKIEQLFGELDEAVNNLQTLKQQVKVLRQSILKAAFSGKLTGSYVSDDELPNGWQYSSLDDLCYKITDGSHNPPTNIAQSSYIMLSSKNVLNDNITLDEPRFISESDFMIENKRTDINEGDVLLTIVGTIGRVAVAPKDLKFTVQRSVAVIKNKQELITSRFLMRYLQYKSSYLNNEARGVTQKGIYLSQLKKILVVKPDFNEQQQIVAKIDELFAICDELDQTIDNALNQSQLLRQSILKQAFSGKLI